MGTVLTIRGPARTSRLWALALGVALLTWLAPRPAYATSLTVTTTADELNTDGDCSLREAVRAANADTAVDRCPAGRGTDTIKLPSGVYTLSRAGAREDGGEMGDLDIAADLILLGSSTSATILDGYTLDRLLDVHAPARVVISALTLRRGYTGAEPGGGLRNGGVLTLRRVLITGNMVEAGYGGGLWNGGTLELVDSTVRANISLGNGGAGIGNAGTLRVRSAQISSNRAEPGSGAGIYNTGTLDINDSTVDGNRASSGAGIHNDTEGQATLARVMVRGNRATGDGGGVMNESWSGPSSGMTINDSSVRGNHAAGSGGGIFSNGRLSITRSTVADNRAAGGGGLYTAASLTMHDTTISGNSAVGPEEHWRGAHGGGIFNDKFSNTDTVTITNSTISGNSAYGSGGGFYNASVQSTPNISAFNNVTIANNIADANRNSTGAGGGVSNPQELYGPTLELANTIVSNNRSDNGVAPDCSGAIMSRGYNLIHQTAGCSLGDATGTIVGQSARLSTLAEHGGPTRTHALLAGSPALDAANPARPGSGGDACRPTDQRDVRRPRDGNGDGVARCDIGAYEAAPASAAISQSQEALESQPAPESLPSEDPPPVEEPHTPVEANVAEAAEATISVTTFEDELNHDGDCSLREAIRAANWNEPVDACPAGTGTDTIRLAAGVYSFTRAGANEEATATGDLDLTASVTLQGAGQGVTVIDAGALDRVVEVHGQFTSATLLELTLRNGKLEAPASSFTDGAGLRSRGTVSARGVVVADNHAVSANAGGGIANHRGRMTLERCSVSGNRIDGDEAHGGGIFNSGTLTITGCTIARNQTAGIDSNTGGISNSGTLTITNSTIRENRGAYFGGGISNSGVMTLRDSTIKNNSGGTGSALLNSGSATITSSVITENETGNEQEASSGAIYNWGTLTIDASLIGGNDSRGIYSERELTVRDSLVIGNRGGIFNNFGTLTLSGITLNNNGARDQGGGLLNNAGTATATNTTISANRAPQGGGGIANTGGGVVALNNVTIVDNVVRAGDGGGISNGDYAAGDRVRLRNTIVANNQDEGGQTADCVGQLSSYGYNLIEHVAGCTIGNVATGNIIAVDPQLGPLADNGGRTKTHMPLPGSPALDSGNPGRAGSSENACRPADQRGAGRPRDGDGDGVARCDIGAVERRSAAGTAAGDELLEELPSSPTAEGRLERSVDVQPTRQGSPLERASGSSRVASARGVVSAAETSVTPGRAPGCDIVAQKRVYYMQEWTGRARLSLKFHSHQKESFQCRTHRTQVPRPPRCATG
jgi:CSLREA domain-containing protein